MSNDNFYIVLPSNATKGNTPSKFHTTLQRSIHLGKSEEWEVGLVDVNLRMSINTVTHDKIIVRHDILFKEGYESNNVTFQLGDAENGTALIYYDSKIHNAEGTEIRSTYYDTTYADPKGMIIFKNNENCSIEFNFEYDNEKVYFVNKSDFITEISFSRWFAYIWGYVDPAEKYCYEPKEWFTIRDIPRGKHAAPYPMPLMRSAGGKRYFPRFKNHILFYKVTSKGTTKFDVTLKPGKYKSVTKLLKQIKSHTELNKYFKIEYLEKQNKMKLSALNIDNGSAIEFTDGLNDVFGFKKSIYEGKEVGEEGILSDMEVDLNRGITTLFIYCDLCQQISVGNTMSQLLRPVAINTQKDGELVQMHYFNPMYLPLNKSFIDTIEVKICDAIGEHIAFVEGVTTIVLHFKRK